MTITRESPFLWKVTEVLNDRRQLIKIELEALDEDEAP